MQSEDQVIDGLRLGGDLSDADALTSERCPGDALARIHFLGDTYLGACAINSLGNVMSVALLLVGESFEVLRDLEPHNAWRRISEEGLEFLGIHIDVSL